MANGHFVISLDFELYWGLFDCRQLEEYGPNILGVRNSIPAMLEVFNDYNIKATFATVGFLFAKNKDELTRFIPPTKPTYNNQGLSPYIHEINNTGDNEKDDPYHFGYDLLELIRKFNHEIACHTFCHYFVSEPGQTTDQFDVDLKAAISIAKHKSIDLTSIVFPRNQYSDEYLNICRMNGIKCFRGTEQSWLYRSRSYEKESQIRRALRLVDAYVNLSGHHGYTKDYMTSHTPINIPSSRFLRPFNPSLSFLDGFRLKRIKNGMKHAAKNNLTYHLWWHPHNFGLHLNDNIKFLKNILDYYKSLQKQFGFQNLTMNQLSNQLIKNGE